MWNAVQLKKVLSANPEATINVECIMNDIDVSGKMTRDLFEEKSASVLQRARAPLQKVRTIMCWRWQLKRLLYHCVY